MFSTLFVFIGNDMLAKKKSHAVSTYRVKKKKTKKKTRHDSQVFKKKIKLL